MKKLVVLTFICFQVQAVFCQKGSACSYTVTKAVGSGLSLKIFRPCDWHEYEGRPGVIKAYRDSAGNNYLAMSVLKQGKPVKLTEQYVRQLYRDFANVISTRTTKLDGIPCVEAVVEFSTERPIGAVYSKSVIYISAIKSNLLSISYGCTGFSKKEVEHLYNENLYGFKKLASLTVWLN